MKKNIKSILFDEYMLFHQPDYENGKVLEIIQNIYSPSLLVKKCFFTPNVLYLNFLINTFQDIQIFSKDTPIYYCFSSHSISYYCLRKLEECGLVNIIWVEESWEDGEVLNKYYKSIGNKSLEKDIIIYDICFEKCRSLTMNDMPLILRLARLLKIDISDINFKEENDVLVSSLNFNRNVLRRKRKNK